MISRTNISVLIATALLGVLLWSVLSIVNEFGKIPPSTPDEPVALTPNTNLPSIRTRLELEQFLTQHSTRGADRIQGYTNWLLARGYPESYRLWDDEYSELASDAAESDYLESDNARLLALAGAGDITAMYVLAERSLRDDPFDSLEWYDRAIMGGSLYAMLKTSDLLEMLSDPELQSFINSASWRGALAQLDEQSPAALEQALAWSIAAIIAGGYTILDHLHANRIARLRRQLDKPGILRACDTAQQYLLETAAARRSRGGAVFLTEQPPIAISVENPETLMPCDLSVPPLITFDDCATYPVIAANEKRASLWVCPYSGA